VMEQEQQSMTHQLLVMRTPNSHRGLML
jgi:hypothetical protein